MGPGAGLELQNLMDLKQLGSATHSQSSSYVGTGTADKVHSVYFVALQCNVIIVI